MLLRKTAAARVAPVVEQFWSRYPTAVILARAPQRELASLLRPLGLQRVRARALKEAAATLVLRHDGQPPRDPRALMALPHAGRYVAAATRCFAFGEQEAVVDANVARVVERFFGLTTTRQLHLADELWVFARSLMGRAPARAWNFAILDFAALVCTARSPRCSGCPVARRCPSRVPPAG